ncbi:hypothetical protein WDW37_15950 [Bdellovibrionota bacterium FG-1]
MSFKHPRVAKVLSPQDQVHATPVPGALAPDLHSGPTGVSNSGNSAPIQASAHDLEQVKVLDEILISKNDNDPRLDREFRMLDAPAKALFREKYAKLSLEKRNERGTIVFLVGREISSPDDVAFLHQVLNEPPCRSLAHCDRDDTGSVSPEEQHWDMANETTLAYPQLVALKSFAGHLTSGARHAELDQQTLAALESAKNSPVRKVALMADEILRTLRKP